MVVLFTTAALALTTPDPGAVALPEGVDLTLPFPAGTDVVVTCAYGPSCSTYHVGTDRTGASNSYYALDIIRDESGNGGGKPIVAVLDGTVVYADWASGGWSTFGRMVLIEHDVGDGHTYMSHYSHLASIDVSVGDTVSANDDVGTMGGSGSYVDGYFGTHLHFALYRDASFAGGPYGGNAVVPELIDGYGDLAHGDLLTAGSGRGAVQMVTVDDEDAGFSLDGPASERWSGGFGDHFLSQPAAATDGTTSTGTWVPDIPETALYKVQAFIPYSGYATATVAPFTLHAHGSSHDTTQDQSIIGGAFHDLFDGSSFKLVAGEHGSVVLHNGSGDSASANVAFDAIRFVRTGDVGAGETGDACEGAEDCAGTLLCTAGTCGDDGIEPGDLADGVSDGLGSEPDPEPDPEPAVEDEVVEVGGRAISDPGGGGCTTLSASAGLSWALVLPVFARRRP
jgi:hypothetical protein